MFIKIIAVFLFSLICVHPVNAKEVELVKISEQFQKAVIKDNSGKLRIIMVGDKIEENTIVYGMSENTVYLKHVKDNSIKSLHIKDNGSETK